MESHNTYIQLYTGNGKGKSTAAFGLALRMAGNGGKVFIGQFVKGMPYGELTAFQKYLSSNITIKQYGRDCFIEKAPEYEDIVCAQKGLEEMTQILQSGNYDLVIMDEVCIAVFFKLFKDKEVIEAIKQRAINTEVVLTGRYASPSLIKIADLVTEMQEIKHYYNHGVEARKGIEF